MARERCSGFHTNLVGHLLTQAQAGVMVTKGTLEEAVWASAGMNGTETFLNLKGFQTRKDDVEDMTPRRLGAMIRQLDDTAQLDSMLKIMLDKRKAAPGRRQKSGAYSGNALDVAFEDWSITRIAQETRTPPQQVEKVWNDCLIEYLEEYQMQTSSLNKYNLSKEELVKHIVDLTKERLMQIESQIDKKREDMHRARVFSEEYNEERLQALKHSATWKKINFRNIQSEVGNKLKRPLKRSEEQRTENIMYEQFVDSKEGIFRYSETANTSGPKHLIPLRKGLAERFDNIYEAWAFLDRDGDWSMSYLEFKQGMTHMKITGLDMEDIISYLDRCFHAVRLCTCSMEFAQT
jgi:hypothetical protein